MGKKEKDNSKNSPFEEDEIRLDDIEILYGPPPQIYKRISRNRKRKKTDLPTPLVYGPPPIFHDDDDESTKEKAKLYGSPSIFPDDDDSTRGK